MLDNLIIKKTGIFFSYKKTLLLLCGLHYGQILIAFIYSLNGDPTLFDAVKSNFGYWSTILWFIYAIYIVKNITGEFDELYTDPVKNKKLKELFIDEKEYLKFDSSMNKTMSYKNQILFAIVVVLLIGLLLIWSIVEEEYIWAGLNLFALGYTWFPYYIHSIVFIMTFFIATAGFVLIVSMKNIYDLGKSPNLSILGLNQMRNLDQGSNQISLIKFTHNIRIIGVFLFNATLKIIVGVFMFSLILVITGISTTSLIMTSCFSFLIIAASFIPQIQIHNLLARTKAEYLDKLEDIREKIRINQYKYLLSMTEEGTPVKVENGDDMERIDTQIKEVKSLITWTYDFPDVLKLLVGAMASVVILIANVMLSLSIENNIT